MKTLRRSRVILFGLSPALVLDAHPQRLTPQVHLRAPSALPSPRSGTCGLRI
jgi:hypothetical protein